MLLVDDSEDDALLLVRELKRGGIRPAFTRVDNGPDLFQALQNGRWDLVITDHNMPGFSSEEAIRMTHRQYPDMPVIIVSGTIGEEAAVNAMRAGAQDYIMKDNLSRLIPAINREIRESQVKLAKIQAETTLEHMAYHDSLTDLVNRREFDRRLQEALLDAQSTEHHHALMYLDLDQFKVINDTCGHVAGDEMLKQISMELARHIRPDDTLARLGGDEFGILLLNCDSENAFRLANILCEVVAEYRLVWQGHPFAVSLSVGLVFIDRNSTNTSDLLVQADLACYAAKDRGRNNVQVFQSDDKDMQQRQTDMQWTSRIHKALESSQFFLCQQPMLGLQESTRNLVQSEFLVRMRGNDNAILPGAFIPAAERFGLMHRIDRRVVEMAFQYLDRTGLGRADSGTFFINLSGGSLGDSELFQFIKALVSRYRIKPERVCFEITETSAIAHLASTIGFIESVRQDGFRFALDDFGSGMSSFSYLKSLPVDFLKIDGSFVKNMLNDPIDVGIVESCHRIGQAVGLKTIAEFVETPDVQKKLCEMGIDFAQGYGIARPAVVR